jgi:uncharacterized membrane protein
MTIRQWAITLAATLATHFGMDFTWLQFTLEPLYRPVLGPILLSNFNTPVALLFYVLYAAAIVILVVRPARRENSGLTALLTGGVLGFIAYGTYDLTNLATLRNFSLTLTIADMAWGTFVTAIASSIGYWVSRRWPLRAA